MPGHITPEWISDPVKLISKTFAASSPVANDAVKFREHIEKIYSENLTEGERDQRYLATWVNGKSEEELKSIPPGSLVRFRCMIFDEQPNFYHQSFVEVKNRTSGEITRKCMMFQDALQLGEDEDVISGANPQSLSEMHSFKCGEVPGDTEWVRQSYRSKFSKEDVTSFRAPNVIANFFADAGKGLRLNDCMDIFGILMIPETTAPAGASGDGVLEELNLENSFRINVIFFEKLLHAHPSLSNKREAILSRISLAGEMRGVVVDLLAKYLLGDRLAAEYLLFNLVSSTQSRVDGLPVGNFPLNITSDAADQSFVTNIHTLFRQILPKMVTFSSTIASLNSAQLEPKLNTNSEKTELITGTLQLSKHTNFVLDEAEMSTGTLNETGVKNVLALQRLAKSQIVQMDYFTQSVEFEMDVPVLIISQGRSLFSVRYVIPLVAQDSEEPSDIPEDVLSPIREYLTAVRFIDYQIEDDVREKIVEKFVEMRKSNRSVSGDDLHDQLEVARYLTMSYGESSLTTEKWMRVMEMEAERQKRLTSRPSAK